MIITSIVTGLVIAKLRSSGVLKFGRTAPAQIDLGAVESPAGMTPVVRSGAASLLASFRRPA